MFEHWLLSLSVWVLGIISLSYVVGKIRKTREQHLKNLGELIQIRQMYSDLWEEFDREKKRLTGLNDKFRESAATHMDKNLEFERQRNQIWDLYRTAGTQAGNAQQVLLRELQMTMMQLNRYREKAGEKPLTVRSELLAIVNEFSEQHGANRSDQLEVSP